MTFFGNKLKIYSVIQFCFLGEIRYWVPSKSLLIDLNRRQNLQKEFPVIHVKISAENDIPMFCSRIFSYISTSE